MKVLDNVYTKFKMHFYREGFKKQADRKDALTTVEAFCMEVIYALDRPLISEFAAFTSISSANAADKVNNLMRKGYINKVQSAEDRRKFYLEVTPKYLEEYENSNVYAARVAERLKKSVSKEDLEAFERVLRVMDEELMYDWNE